MKIGENDIIKNYCSCLEINYTFICQNKSAELDWLCKNNGWYCTRKVNQVFYNTLQGSRLRIRPRNRWWNCVQTNNNKLKIGMGGQKTEQNGGSPLRRLRSSKKKTTQMEQN